MNKIVFVLTLIAAGVVIVALPDSGKRLFSISRDHGPSAQDAIGLVLVLIGYAWFLVQTWKRRQKLFQYKSRFSFRLMSAFIVIGIVVIIVSVINDYGYWWAVGAIILAVLQAIIFYIALAD